MEYITHNDEAINTVGTYLQGHVTARYSKLKKIFGPHTAGDGYRMDAYWKIKFSDGEVASIYNYKNGKNYCGNSGTPKTKITDWHIGGHSNVVVDRIIDIILDE